MISTWKDFFNLYAPYYERESFTTGTLTEVDFIVAEFNLEPGARILDMGCGTGRHAIELARRGYQVTGVDISAGMLTVARHNALQVGVEIDFVECAAQDYEPTQQYDLVMSLCEGALCLLEADDDVWGRDMAIFANLAAALKNDGHFIATVLNAFRLIRSISDADTASGQVDLFSLTSNFVFDCQPEPGKKISYSGIERYYTPSELTRMVNRIGLKIDRVYGGTAGAWRRQPLELDEMEIMIIGHKKAGARRASSS